MVRVTGLLEKIQEMSHSAAEVEDSCISRFGKMGCVIRSIMTRVALELVTIGTMQTPELRRDVGVVKGRRRRWSGHTVVAAKVCLAGVAKPSGVRRVSHRSMGRRTPAIGPP